MWILVLAKTCFEFLDALALLFDQFLLLFDQLVLFFDLLVLLAEVLFQLICALSNACSVVWSVSSAVVRLLRAVTVASSASSTYWRCSRPVDGRLETICSVAEADRHHRFATRPDSEEAFKNIVVTFSFPAMSLG